jgi:hypothetical protein
MSNRSQIILTNKNELSYEGERAQGDGYSMMDYIL